MNKNSLWVYTTIYTVKLWISVVLTWWDSEHKPRENKVQIDEITQSEVSKIYSHILRITELN